VRVPPSAPWMTTLVLGMNPSALNDSWRRVPSQLSVTVPTRLLAACAGATDSAKARAVIPRPAAVESSRPALLDAAVSEAARELGASLSRGTPLLVDLARQRRVRGR
jgi:hypothetical protein